MNFIFKKYKVTIWKYTNKIIFFKNFSISYFFSRFGNNLQQIAIGIIYSNLMNGNFYSPEHTYIKKFCVKNNKIHSLFFFFKKFYRFFYFYENSDLPKKLDEEVVINNIQPIFKKYIEPNIKFLDNLDLDPNLLVIHVRSGDIFENKKHDYYQNPINYYRKIINDFEKILVVTSADKKNPICEFLATHKKVKIQSSTFENDFNTLYNATNLATSGVGTFPIAAAMMSKKLKNFYFSNLYLKEHLNPEMLIDKNINTHQFLIDSSYTKSYKEVTNFKNLILDNNIEVKRI